MDEGRGSGGRGPELLRVSGGGDEREREREGRSKGKEREKKTHSFSLGLDDLDPLLKKKNSKHSSWPVAWFVSEKGATSALAMVNSNAIDVVAGSETLTWRLAGGEVDLFVLSGPTPALVAAQLASLVGLPTLQPPWAFGAMNSKYGYASAAQCRAVVDSFDAAGVPLEVRLLIGFLTSRAPRASSETKVCRMKLTPFPPSLFFLSLFLFSKLIIKAWVSDSQYMSNDRAFTWGEDFSKSEMRDFVKHLRSTDKKWVPILDPVIRAERGYAPFDEASADGGIFLKGVDGKPYLGQVRRLFARGGLPSCCSSSFAAAPLGPSSPRLLRIRRRESEREREREERREKGKERVEVEVF